MARRSKKDRPPAISQSILAANLLKLRNQVYAHLSNDTARNRQLAKDSDTSLSQIQRILNQDLAPGIDMLERIASALSVRPPDLLTPYFAAHDYQYPTKQDSSLPQSMGTVNDPPTD